MEIFSIILLTLGLGLGLVAFFAVLNAFFDERIGKTRFILENMPGRSFLVGLVNGIFFVALILVLLALAEAAGGLAQILALIVMIPLGIGLTFGWAGVVRLVGERLAPESGLLIQTVWGALGLGLACALPFLGWFLMLPFISMLGLGALITSFFYRKGGNTNEEDREE